MITLNNDDGDDDADDDDDEDDDDDDDDEPKIWLTKIIAIGTAWLVIKQNITFGRIGEVVAFRFISDISLNILYGLSSVSRIKLYRYH